MRRSPRRAWTNHNVGAPAHPFLSPATARMGHTWNVKASIIAASIGLAIVGSPAPAISQTSSQPTAQPSQTSAQLSALFVDCSGNYTLVSTTSGSVERQGRVQRLAGAQLPPQARDG